MPENVNNSPNYHWLVLATVSIGTFMATLDSSIVNVALPTISGKLHSNLTSLQWVVTSYLLAISSLLPVFGRLSDLLGRKKIYSLGFILFTLGSGFCGLAQNIWFLVGTRVFQAVGASMLMSNAFAIITSIFPLRERGKALGLVGTVVALGGLTGPSLGGFLIGLSSWRAIFYINVPIGILGFLASRRVLPADEPRKGHETFDFGGALTFTLGIVSLLLGINHGEDWGWSSLPVLLSILLGIVLLVWFARIERRTQFPMIDLALFRNRPFLMGSLSGWMSFVAMFTNAMLMPFYLQQVLNYPPSQVGLLMTVFPVMMAITAPLSGHASDKFGPVALTTSGMIVISLGLLYFSILPASVSFYQIIPGSLLMGMGAGIFQSPNNSSVMGSVPPQKLGVAGGINSLVRNLGTVTGIALAVSLFEALGGVSKPSAVQIPAFMSAYHSVLRVAMVIALTGAVISLNRKGHTPHQSSDNSPA